ncbi:MAG TPA: LacI family DNA-binding transcriptional regulator [Acidimicrobiales bacterium]|nr:LacI family DNA-binding transcriptional regulator [Acidimicrobiales bacterium]
MTDRLDPRPLSAGRRPTLADVARLAGVSQQTVSRVLNGSAEVHPGTRARIQQCIERVGYRPNRAARYLATNRSKVLGVMSAPTALYGPAATLYAVDLAARQAGYSICAANIESGDERSVEEALEVLLDQPVEGIVVVGHGPAVEPVLARIRMPVPIVATAGEAATTIPYVSTEQTGGSKMATEHLLGLGHPTVAHVAGPTWSVEARLRAAGWRQALEAAGRAVPTPVGGDWQAASGYVAGRQLARDLELTAVFAANDQMALGVLRALAEAGRRVPEDVSVVGFDDVPDAAYFSPPLTTVRQDLRALAQAAVALVLAELGAVGHEPPVTTHTLPSRLVVRASTSRCRPRRPPARRRPPAATAH